MRPLALAICTLAGLLAACDVREVDVDPSGPDLQPASTETTEEAQAAEARDWQSAMTARVEHIDGEMPGELGVHIRNLADGGIVDHNTGRDWYLASTIKIPVAIAVLEQVEGGELSLDQTLTLQRSDFVDGAGSLIWQEPGSNHTIADLIRRSVRDSDSVATDMLIRLVGEDELNRRIRSWSGRGDFGAVTTLLQVRYDAYGELHAGVAELSNMDLVKLRNAEAGRARYEALADSLGVASDALTLDSIDEAFARYYRTGRNSGRLPAFGDLLGQLADHSLLSAEHSELLLGHMRSITTGDRRIQAGLPPGTGFAQKTGTQLARACNVGIIEPGSAEHPGIIIAACAEEFESLEQAEQAFQALGEAIGSILLR